MVDKHSCPGREVGTEHSCSRDEHEHFGVGVDEPDGPGGKYERTCGVVVGEPDGNGPGGEHEQTCGVL